MPKAKPGGGIPISKNTKRAGSKAKGRGKGKGARKGMAKGRNRKER